MKKVGVQLSFCFCLFLNSISYADLVPNIVREGGIDKLVLPAQLEELIQTKYSGFRVPSNEDVKGLWSGIKTDGYFPFVAWGDFDGNTYTDVAILLLGPSSIGSNYYEYSGEYVVAIFNQTDNVYSVRYEDRRNFSREGPSFPQQISFNRLVKGNRFELSNGEIFIPINDSVYWKYTELGEGIIYWVNTKYEVIAISYTSYDEK